MTERVKAGGYENRQCLSDNQRLAKAVGLLRCRGPEPPKPDYSRPGIPDICCEPTPPIPHTGLVALRGLSARQENRIAMVVAIGGASCTAPVASAYELIQKPTTALMRRGSTAKPPSPDSPAPISGKDNRTVAKVGRDERSRFE
jgi:hypothetical protein